MDWKTVASYIGDAAPLLSSALRGPAAIAADAASKLATALDVEAKPYDVIRAMNRDPDTRDKLHHIESEALDALQALRRRRAEAEERIKPADTCQHRPRRTFWAVAALTILTCGLAALALFRGDAEALRLISELTGALATLFLSP